MTGGGLNWVGDCWFIRESGPNTGEVVAGEEKGIIGIGSTIVTKTNS